MMDARGARTRLQSDVLERISDGILALDSDLRITYVNQPAESILERVADQLLGKLVWDVFPETAETVVESSIREAYDTAEPGTFEHSCERLGRHFEFRLYPDEHGVSIYCTDSTTRKTPESGLESWNRQLTALVENTDAAIYIKNSDGQLTYMNRAAADLFDLGPEDVIGKYDRELFDPQTAAEIREIDTRVIETGTHDIREAERIVGGTRAIFLENTFPYQDETGAVVGVMGISHDITEIDEREAELRQKHDRLDEFASVLSHDLMNPLTIAQGRFSLLDAAVESEHLEPLGKALERIGTMTENTLLLARQGDVVAAPEPFCVTDLVGRCWAMVDPDEATLELADEFTLIGDPDRLRHVFENLFRNAVVHGGQDVSVRIGQIDDVGFYVEDDGPGIPETARMAVFEPGHRSRSGGTGFGLTIVQRIAQAHGWEVAITDGTDGGARFEFTGVEFAENA